MVPSLVTITPTLATEWLTKLSAKQRNKISHHAELLAADIKNGRWMLTHQAIAFDRDGNLIDGQHRLEAVVLAGVPITSWVFRGVDAAVMPYIDRHAKRTIAYRIKCLGLDINHSVAAAAKAMMLGTDLSNVMRVGDFELIEFCTAHAEAIQFAMHLMPKKYANAVVQGLVARMWYHVDQAEIERFCYAATDRLDGDETELDRAIRRCGMRLMQDKSGHAGSNGRAILYRRWQSLAHSACVMRRPLSKVYEVSEDLFPLPAGSSAAA